MSKNTWGNSNHQAEPWTVREVVSAMDRGRTKDLCIFDADGDLVLTVATVRRHEEFSNTAKDNALRIVCCVNDCKQ